jgi:hypothetical protein
LLLPPAPPLQNLIFRFLQSRQKIQIWLFEQTDLRIEGRIIVSRAPPPADVALPPPPPCVGCLCLQLRPLLLTILTRHTHSSYLRSVYLQGFDEYMNLVLDEAEEVSGALPCGAVCC